MSTATSTSTETTVTFACFGAHCSISAIGDTDVLEATIADLQTELLEAHDRFTRFEPTSELSRLNADPRSRVPVSAPMAEFVAAAIEVAIETDGLVDATVLDGLESSGYRSDLRSSLPLALALGLAPARRPATAPVDAPWRRIGVDLDACAVFRPPGVRLDSGGIVKGLLADVLGGRLRDHDAYAIDCAGDLRLGGADELTRPVHVASPFGGEMLHVFELARGGIATSGIGRRSWLDANARPAHHLLDPGSGRPAFTGIIQVTALAPTALQAEARSKAALLSGPSGAAGWLPDGGVVVYDDGSHLVLPERA